MYISPKFPSLVEAVLAKQRAEELKKAYPPSNGKLPALPRAPITPKPFAPVVPPEIVVVAPKEKKPKRKKKQQRTYGCMECKRDWPWQLHKVTCPVLVRRF